MSELLEPIEAAGFLGSALSPASIISGSGEVLDLTDLTASGVLSVALSPTVKVILYGGFIGFTDGENLNLPSPPVEEPPVFNHYGGAGSVSDPELGTDPDQNNAFILGTFPARADYDASGVSPPFIQTGSGDVLGIDVESLGVFNGVTVSPPTFTIYDGSFIEFAGEPVSAVVDSELPTVAFSAFSEDLNNNVSTQLQAYDRFGLQQVEYRIYLSTQIVPAYTVIAVSGRDYATSLTIARSNPYATVYVEARVTDVSGNVRTVLASSSGLIDSTPPTAPPWIISQVVLSRNDGTQQVRFSWGEASDNTYIDYYDLYLVENNAVTATKLNLSGVEDTTFLYDGIAITDETYEVVAIDSASLPSTGNPRTTVVVSTVCPPCPPVPEPPGAIVNLRTSGITETTTTLLWNAATAAVGYEVSLDGGTTSRFLGNVTTYAVTGLAAGSVYSAKVRSINAEGTRSAWYSVTWTTTPVAQPSLPPSNLRLTALDSTSLTFAWGDPGAGVTGFETETEDLGFTFTKTISGLISGTSYRFKIRSYDAFGNRSPWVELRARTSGGRDATATYYQDYLRAGTPEFMRV